MKHPSSCRNSVALAALALLSSACNAVLGINEPLEGERDAGAGAGRDGQPDGRIEASSDAWVGDADAERPPAVIPASHPWADWPMPNPTSVGLPNPQTYDPSSSSEVVIDAVTRLEWQRTVGEQSLGWTDAVSYCHNLPLDGGGWRLPSRIELLSIVDFTREGAFIDTRIFRDAPAALFWSASPLAADAQSSWAVNFGFSTVLTDARPSTDTYRVRCVRRGGTSIDRYEVANGVVRDTKTKLSWQQIAPAAPYTWSDANAYCVSLTLGGAGWRLPSVVELETIVDEGRSDPAIDAKAFPNAAVEYFWTSSTLPRFPSHAWTVYFGNGSSTFFDLSQSRQVRCVR